MVIRKDPRPRSRWTIDFPRCPAPLARRTFRIRTARPTTSNSTSVLGSGPSFSRISTGIVTWPRVVILMVLPRQVILELHHIRDINEFVARGVIATPPLVTHGNAVVAGRVPREVELAVTREPSLDRLDL